MSALLIGYLLLVWVTGVALTFISRMPWEFEGRLAVGVPLGFGAAAMLTWLLAIPFGMSGSAVFVGTVALAVVLGACVQWTRWREPLRDESAAMLRRWQSRQALPLALLVVLAGIFFIPFYMHALELKPQGLWAGYVNIWGDWCTHLSMAGYLSHARDLVPPQNPFYSGFRLTYPFLPDLFSGMLLHLGMSLECSLPLTSAVLSIALVVVFYSTALRLVGNRWAAALGSLVFFLSGGLGFFNLLNDARPASGTVSEWLRSIITLVAHPAREYTLDRTVGFQWLNPVLAYLVPQRTTLFGFSLGLLVVSLLWYGRSRRQLRETILAGIVLGTMPLLHAATYFDLLLLASIGSGALDLNRASQKDLPNVSFQLLDNEELNVADWAQASTPGEAVFLTGWKNNHPILTLSRRVEVMGYPGWLWTWGLPYPQKRQQDVVDMYRGGPRTVSLLRAYNVAYVVIGPQERQEIAANVAYYEGRYPRVYRSPTGEYEVFRVG